MKSIFSEHLKRVAMVILVAGFRENVIDTWNKSLKNPKNFIKKIQPILLRYEKSIDTREVEQLKKDVLEGTDENVELLYKMNKFEAVPVREVVKSFETFSPTALKILRDNLTRPYGLFDKETPDTLKTNVSKILKKTVNKDELKSIYDSIKETIVSFKNPDRKKMFQSLVLKPVQVALGKITPMEIDVVKRNKFLSDLKDIRKRKDIEEKYSEKLMIDTRTKGAPSSQMRTHTQQLYAATIRKLAYFLINNLQAAKSYN